MMSKEALKSMCNHCEKLSIRDGFIGCPFRNISNDYCEEFEIIKKELKALEIIKTKNVDIDYIKACFYYKKGDFKEYNAWAVHYEDEELSQEEYDLLKEVLEDESLYR